jgi:hypothetical protein
MIVTNTVLSNEMDILVDVNVKEVGTNNATTTDAAGRFSINVASADSILEFSHAGYDYDQYRAGDIKKYIELFPVQLPGVDVVNNYKSDGNNTGFWLIGGILAVIAAIKLSKKTKKQPRKVTV